MRLHLVLVAALAAVLSGVAAQTSATLLPPDTLFMIALPDVTAAGNQISNSSYASLWRDQGMRPFRMKLAEGWSRDFVEPLERELDMNFAQLAKLIQGPATFAVTHNGWNGNPDKPLGFLFAADAKEKSDDLRRHLTELHQRWSLDPRRSLRTEEIRGLKFSALSFSTNELPRTLRQFFPGALEYQEIGQEPPKVSKRKPELFIGQVKSLVLVGNSFPLLERVVDRLTGGGSPSLADQAGFQVHQNALFRESVLYGWLDSKAIFEMVLQAANERKQNPLAPNAFELFQPAKLLSASGLDGLQTVGFSVRAAVEGTTFETMLAVPDSRRTGIFRVISGEPKEASLPSFVPADVVKFQRWRIDGQKTWTAFEKLLSEASPQTLNSLNFIIDTANLAANQKNPGFDLRKALIGNLGDDFMVYEKAGQEGASDPSVGPSVYLFGSPNPELFATSVQNVLILVTAHAGAPEEREFLGRKIFSVPMPALNLGTGAENTRRPPRTLHYAGGGGYVAFSTDVRMLEEYLRSGEHTGKTLRDTPGLMEASQRVLGPGCSYYRFANSRQSIKPVWESLRKGGKPNSVGALNTVNNLPGMKTPEKRFTEWLDFSLLPPFESIASYFHFTVGGNRATVDGLSYILFAPTVMAAGR